MSSPGLSAHATARRRPPRPHAPRDLALPVLVATLAVAAACAAPPPTGPPPQPAPAATAATPADTAPADTAPADAAVPTPRLPTATLPDGTRLTLELAVTPEEISNGLMFRPSLRPDRGMLFLFEHQRTPSFWMKNTLVPLDIVFLDGAGKVVDVAHDAQPCAADPCPQYLPQAPVWAVLEVAAGGAAQHAVDDGAVIEFHRVPGFPRPAE